MELDHSQVLFTGVDSLLNLVNKKGRISISHAAKVLNVDPKTVEVWADTLEELGDLISKYGISERKIMSPDYYHKQTSSIKTLLWQINPISKNIVLKKQEKKQHDKLQNKIKEYIALKTQIQQERALLARERTVFREMMESERRAFTALKNIYNLKLFDPEAKSSQGPAADIPDIPSPELRLPEEWAMLAEGVKTREKSQG